MIKNNPPARAESHAILFYIVRDTYEETIFHAPYLFRRTSFVCGGFFGFCSVLFICFLSNMPYTGLLDALIKLVMVLLSFGGMLAGFYGALRREMRLDYKTKMYEQTVGLFCFTWQRRGPLDDIQAIYVRQLYTESAYNEYEVGMLWKQPRVPCSWLERLLNVSSKRYSFAVMGNVQFAEAAAQSFSARLRIPYRVIS